MTSHSRSIVIRFINRRRRRISGTSGIIAVNRCRSDIDRVRPVVTIARIGSVDGPIHGPESGGVSVPFLAMFVARGSVTSAPPASVCQHRRCNDNDDEQG